MRNHRAIIRCGDHCEIRMTSISPVSNGELVVAPEKVSICGTDIQILRGQRDDPAPIVGHEGLSTVIAAGRGVNDFLGERVTINPTHPSDAGFLLGHNVNGLLQEQVKIPATAVDAGLVSRVSAAIPAARGTLIEPLAVATYALECLRIERPDSLVVVGDGLIGNLASLIAPRILGQDVLIAMVHRSELGLSWTSAFNPRVVNGLSLGDVVPHMGWSRVCPPQDSVLFDGVDDERFYFVHSYAATRDPAALLGPGPTRPPRATWATHGQDFIAAVENGALCATQFHPEKSGDAGAQLLRNWLTTL